MPRNYRKYTDSEIVQYASAVRSLAGLLKKLDLKPVGGNYANMKRTLQNLKVDCSHWTGQSWNKGQRTKDWSEYTKIETIKPHLLKERGHICENCKLTVWLEMPIPLEVHHIDGDRTNNIETNLRLLCPNCHNFTHNYCNRKR